MIDTTVPNATIDSGPANPSNSADATFYFSSGDPAATFECRLDGGAFEVSRSPRAYTGLANGSHTFDVRAKDAANNTSAGRRITGQSTSCRRLLHNCQWAWLVGGMEIWFREPQLSIWGVGINGTLVNGATTAPGKVGNALSFDGDR